MKAGHIGAVSLALCAAAGAAMFALSGGKKAEYCSLGEYHGRVAIFAPDERTLPRQITAIAVHTLPSADRAALSGGSAASVSVVTGPEGGFTPEEVALAQEKGLRICTLGPRILRCETAPLCALTCVLFASGALD